MIDEKLENGNIRELLLEKERMEPLEHLIEEYSNSLESLHKKRLDFGATPTKEELPEILQEVKDFVDKFLDIKVDSPRICYHSLFLKDPPYDQPLKQYILGAIIFACGIATPLAPFFTIGAMFPFYFGFKADIEIRHHIPFYDNLSKLIMLFKGPEAALKHLISHEYNHHVQYASFDKSISLEEYHTDYKSIREGHARGVQRAAAHHFKEKYNNEAHLSEVTDVCLAEFKAAYKWMCKNSGKEPNANLLKTSSTKDRIEKLYDYYNFRPSPYAIGSSFLSIEEEKHGKEIYKKLIHGDTSFL